MKNTLEKVYNDQIINGKFIIPEGVTSIGNNAFWNCSSLTSIVIPEGVTSIGNHAFYGCYSLTSIVIPKGVTSIGNDAFWNCSSLTSIVIPEGVTSIGNYAFCGCYSLTSIVIPKGVTSIGNHAFYGCSSLTSIVIPKGVTSIGNHAFYGCSSLTSIEINGKVHKCKNIDGYLFIIESSKKGVLKGFTFVKIENEEIIKKEGYVATRGDFHAHGETIEKAVEDLNFKIWAETFKSEPLTLDTILNVQKYRILTGACEQGCKMWMEQNNFTKNEVTVKELLPLLEKTHAYGVEKIKSLIQKQSVWSTK